MEEKPSLAEKPAPKQEGPAFLTTVHQFGEDGTVRTTGYGKYMRPGIAFATQTGAKYRIGAAGNAIRTDKLKGTKKERRRARRRAAALLSPPGASPADPAVE